jgi:5-methylcytosine-specific restriction endonuclease McrA
MRKHSQTYFEYIHSELWKSRSAECIRKAKYRCEECGNIGKLVTHHKNYQRLGNELPEDLQVLCPACHSQRHKRGDYAITNENETK